MLIKSMHHTCFSDSDNLLIPTVVKHESRITQHDLLLRWGGNTILRTFLLPEAFPVPAHSIEVKLGTV